LLHSYRQLAENRHVMCVVEKAGFEPRTLGTGAERATNCATSPVEKWTHRKSGHRERMVRERMDTDNKMWMRRGRIDLER
jgi:hypothetical protein